VKERSLNEPDFQGRKVSTTPARERKKASISEVDLWEKNVRGHEGKEASKARWGITLSGHKVEGGRVLSQYEKSEVERDFFLASFMRSAKGAR